MKKIFKTEVAGRSLVVETGQLAQLANGAALIRYGETVVMSSATASNAPRDGIDFFPLSVDFEEKLYAVGKIPGGFIKREGRPSENSVLTSRVIDRQMRPRFPKDLRNDVCIVNTVMSVDQDNAPEFAAIIGTAISLSISDIPFNGPIAGIIIGLVDDEIIMNPTVEQRENSKMHVTLSADLEKIVMIEAGADEVPDEKMFEAIKAGHEEIKKLINFIQEITDEIGKAKFEYESSEVDANLFNEVKDYAYDDIKEALFTFEKSERDANINAATKKVKTYFSEKYPENVSQIGECLYKLQKKIVRTMLKEEQKRVDGRDLKTIRPLSSEVGILPRTHGSGLFQRGQTQVLTNVTLGPLSEIQKLDGIDLSVETKRYIHHYNFPAYSVGDARPSRGPGRRELGHGALAERSLVPVLPNEEEFPYTIRLVSEILMSNGSTSQGSVCASTLALMDAGVPIKEPVAGISAGLITNDGDTSDYLTFMDIQGIEDFFGDMDFKVAGTKNGITSIQVDIKVDGLTYDIIEEAFEITRKGRIQIIDEVIVPTINEPRMTLSKYAPKIYQIDINPDKIRDVIGQGGKVINRIIDETGVKIDIEDTGKVYVLTSDDDAAAKALKIIDAIVTDAKPGQTFPGKVTRIMNFGAFVEYAPGKEGLVHISKLDNKRVEKVEDVVKVGDDITIKVLEIDRQGRVNLGKVID